jgi:hypothetical protein
MLAQAMSSTKLTAAISTSNPVLICSGMSASNVLSRFTPQSRISGYCCFIPSEMVFISARACWMETPGLSLPTTTRVWFRRISLAGSMVNGV